MMDFLLGPVTITIALGITSFVLFYFFSVRRYDYWKKKGVPTVKTYPIIGPILEASSKPLHQIEYDRYFEYGRIYGNFEGSKPTLSVADPDLVKDILVKDFGMFHDRRHFETGEPAIDKMLSVLQGEDWKRVRSIVTPTFSTGKIKRMMGIFKEGAKTLEQNFNVACKEGKSIDAKKLYGAFTMDVIASSAFSTKIDSHNDPNNPFVQNASKAFNLGINWRFLLFFLAPRLMKRLKISVFPSEMTDFFKTVTFQMVKQRRESGKSRNDFLQLLIDTAKEETEEERSEAEDKGLASNYGETETSQQIFKTILSKKLSMDELVAQCLIFFFAGYDTTASTLSFASYFLALNPEVQDRLRREVDEALKEHNGDLNYEAIQSMKYLDNVISETLRLFPPLSRLERVSIYDYDLGDTGIKLSKGTLVSIPSYAMHRDQEYFPDPEKFDPDRFTPEERSMRNPYTYLPFGAGPRNCVGMRFALVEMKVCLAHVIANFIIKRTPETEVPLEFTLGAGLLQPKKITLKMEARKDLSNNFKNLNAF